MKKIVLTMVLSLIFSVNLQASDWVDLFNGKSLDGWKVLNGTATYEVVDGVIVGTSVVKSPNTFLATEKDYDDFILEYEVKLAERLNSGVQIRSLSLPEYRDGRVHGYQVELDPSDRAWTGGIYDEARRGWLYNLENNPPAKEAYQHGEWNHFRVEAIGASIRVWVNGVPTVDLVDDKTLKGFIALQVHGIGNDTERAGSTVSFRNIRILTQNFWKHVSPNTEDIPQVSYLKNQLTERERREGWRLLWDGKTTDGWRGAKIDHFPTMGWHIKDGILIVEEASGAESGHGGDIVTTGIYGSFELELDFLYTEGANSGIKYFVDPELNKGAGSAIGCEFQILDDEKHPDAKAGSGGNRTMASLYDLIPANAQLYAPNESNPKRLNKYSWNRAKIIANGQHVEHYLNGIKVLEYDRETQMFRTLVQRSKYAKWPNFGTWAKGHILLQDHGNEVSYKNIKVRVLD